MLTHPEMTAVDIRQRVLVPYRPDAEMVAAVSGLSLREYIKLAIAAVGPALTKMLGRCKTQDQRLAVIYGRWWLEPADRGR